MADEQDTPDSAPDGQPPAKKVPAKAPAKKVPAKTPAKKAAVKKTPAKAPAKKVPAKAPAKAAKSTPTKRAPATKAPVPKAPPPTPPETLLEAAKETAAQAKSTVTSSRPVLVSQPAPRSKVPVAAAVAAGLLAVLVVFLARRDSDED